MTYSIQKKGQSEAPTLLQFLLVYLINAVVLLQFGNILKHICRQLSMMQKDSEETSTLRQCTVGWLLVETAQSFSSENNTEIQMLQMLIDHRCTRPKERERE